MARLHELQVRFDTHIQQVALNGFTDLLEKDISSCRAGKVHLKAVRITRLGKEFESLVGIVFEGFNDAITHLAFSNVAGGALAKAVKEGVDDGINVHGVVHGLSYQGVLRWLVDPCGQVVEGDVVDTCAGIAYHLDVRHAE